MPENIQDTKEDNKWDMEKLPLMNIGKIVLSDKSTTLTMHAPRVRSQWEVTKVFYVSFTGYITQDQTVHSTWLAPREIKPYPKKHPLFIDQIIKTNPRFTG